ncbi:MAG: hypothetical protein JXC32_03420, partial [Anaerolineae bacterium]|nr:hypothetical protein [Anaerolineae bacterium]
MNNRVTRLKGTAYEVGHAMGRTLGPRLAANIDRYTAARVSAGSVLDAAAWRAGALPWLRALPQRFQEEFEGMAEGAQLPLQWVAEWIYLEVILDAGCSGAVVTLGDRVWVARNNDSFVPDMWGYATIREIAGCIPTITFGLEGDVFTPTGINQERLWLHYNYLPAWDAPGDDVPHLPCYAWIVEALETCRTLQEVEALLAASERDGGMLLFAVDGKSANFALYECPCAGFVKREATEGWLVGTNHYVHHAQTPTPQSTGRGSTVARYARLVALIEHLLARDS